MLTKAARSLTIALLFFCLIASAVLAETKVATDPSRIGVGARPLGMGKCFIGLADDISSIFTNPAGLASLTNWQATSFSGKFISEYDYLNFGVARPTSYGTFGFGFVGGGISFRSMAVTTEVSDGVRLIESSTEGSTYSFNNNVYLLSWGQNLKGLFNQALFNDLAVGANLKFFALNLTGPGISGGTAAGNELDLGLHYKPKGIFQAGVTVQDALPFSAGGKIKWGNGDEESLPSTLKLGSSLRLLGDEGWRKIGVHQLALNFDYDIFPYRDVPQLGHLGLEWSPLSLLDIRLGIDQETVGTGTAGVLETTNNLTAGVGLYIDGFRFDYAYHQYSGVSSNDTHYFSLSYGVSKKQPKRAPGAFIMVGSPADGAIEYADRSRLIGLALRQEVIWLDIQDKPAEIDITRSFDAPVDLRMGRNIIPIKVFDQEGKMLDDLKWKIVRLISFVDVTGEYWAKLPVEQLATLGTITGYPDATFRPDGTITRAEICSLLMKLQSTVDSQQSTVNSQQSLLDSRLKTEDRRLKTKFTDVPAKHWAAGYIAQAAAAGIVTGYPGNKFKPNGRITRAEGLAIISRFARLPEPRELVNPYKDVPSRFWGLKAIVSAKEAGYLDYVTGELFLPNAALKRGEAAYLLAKTEPVKNLIKDKL